MSRIRATGLLTVLILAVTAGCTNSAGPDAASKSTLSSGSATSTEATQNPESVLDAALEGVSRAEAISYKARTVTSVNDSVTTYDTSGVWDSRQPSWKSITRYQTPLDTGPTSFAAKLRYVGSRLYGSVSSDAYPSTAWLDLTHSHDPGYGLQPRWLRSGSMPTDIDLLTQIQPTAIESVGQSTVLVGNVPNRVALEFLNLTGHLSEIGLGMFVQGQTIVRLTLDQTRFPVRVDVLGSDVDLVSPNVPDYVKDELGASGYRADYTKAQDVPPIKAPTNIVN